MIYIWHFLELRKCSTASPRIVITVLVGINPSKEIEHNSYIRTKDTIFFLTEGTS